MPAGRADLFKLLEELNIQTTTVEHMPLFTVAESAEIERDIPGGHTKNLFLKDAKGRLLLLVAHAHTRVDLKTLPGLVGCGRLSFGSAALLQDVLGVPPGSVTAFAVINDRSNRVEVILDQELMAYDTINCHPLTNTATTNIAREDLLRFFHACGHAPRILYVRRDAARSPQDVD